MEIRDYVAIVRQRWVWIVASTLLFLLGAGLLTLSTTPEYRSQTQVYVSVPSQDGSSQNLAQGSTFSQNQVAGFAELATSPLVLDPLIREYGLDVTSRELASAVSASVREGTALINVSVTAASPQEAADLSNWVAQSMSQVLPELQRPLDSAVSPVKLTVTRPAFPAEQPSSPNAAGNLLFGGVLGLVLGLGAAVVASLLDTRIRSTSDLRAVSEFPLLGSVSFDLEAQAHPLAIKEEPQSARAESIRRLRTNLRFINAPAAPRTIVVTSSVPAEGKSTTAANLALAMADAGEKVLLVDADLRRPSIAAMFGLEGGVGLTTILIGSAALAQVVQQDGSGQLDVVAAGEIPPNPSELLGSNRMEMFLDEAADLYDLVIVDSAPLLPVTDGAILAKHTDGALFVVSAARSTSTQVAAALQTLETVDARVLGLVLNCLPTSKQETYAYYGYGPGENAGSVSSSDSRYRNAAEVTLRHRRK